MITIFKVLWLGVKIVLGYIAVLYTMIFITPLMVVLIPVVSFLTPRDKSVKNMASTKKDYKPTWFYYHEYPVCSIIDEGYVVYERDGQTVVVPTLDVMRPAKSKIKMRVVK